MKPFHFTCSHGAAQIGRRGALKPNPHPLLDLPPLVWLTENGHATREDLGLSSIGLGCDRMAHRYVVTGTAACVRWLDITTAPGARLDALALLHVGTDPSSWLVSTMPLSARAG